MKTIKENMWIIPILIAIVALIIALQIVEIEPVYGQYTDELLEQAKEEIPEEVVEAAEKYGDKYNICPELLESIAYQESRYKANAKNRYNIGLMQINTKFHTGLAEKLEADLYTVDGSMHVACEFLSYLFEKYEDPAAVLSFYRWGYQEAQDVLNGRKEPGLYTKQVLGRAEALERLHGK